MKKNTYEVLRGVIYGKEKGETVELSADEAKAYGAAYVKKATTKKDSDQAAKEEADAKAKEEADAKAKEEAANKGKPKTAKNKSV